MKHGRTRWVRVAAYALLLVSTAFGLGLLTTSGGHWETGVPLPVATGELQGVVVGGQPVILGGIGPGWSVSSRVFTYNPSKETWSRLPDLPVPLNHHAAAVVDEAIYVMGGASSFGPDMVERAQVYMLPPRSDHWQERAAMPSPRWGHGAATLNGKIYVAGGRGEDDHELFVFDPETNRWDVASSIPTRREHLAVLALNGLLYTIGGRIDGVNVDVVEVFDPRTGHWETRTPLPTPRSGVAASVVGGLIHVAGGEDLRANEVLAAHEVYDPQADSWKLLAPLPLTRHGASGLAVGGEFMVVGGSSYSGGRSPKGWLARVDVYVQEEADP